MQITIAASTCLLIITSCLNALRLTCFTYGTYYKQNAYYYKEYCQSLSK